MISLPHAALTQSFSDFVQIDGDFINRRQVVHMSLHEWDSDDSDETPEFPFRLSITLITGEQKDYDIDTSEYASEIITKLNGTWVPKPEEK